MAARRLIVGHLDTSDLDPVTAKAVELLAAADMVAAEHWQAPSPRLWRDPLWLMTITVMVVLVLVSLAMLVLVRRTDQSAAQRDRIGKVSEQIKDCVDPSGVCYREGEARTAAAVAALSKATQVITECADAYSGTDAIDACIARRLPDRG